ncbi:MAG: hypothetical protein EHM18_00835 [Acidobacteria bacterium]|nr:MAG: hypothetical protein EHM18_00835 [Acidobacteriota bacterium]
MNNVDRIIFGTLAAALMTNLVLVLASRHRLPPRLGLPVLSAESFGTLVTALAAAANGVLTQLLPAQSRVLGHPRDYVMVAVLFIFLTAVGPVFFGLFSRQGTANKFWFHVANTVVVWSAFAELVLLALIFHERRLDGFFSRSSQLLMTSVLAAIVLALVLRLRNQISSAGQIEKGPSGPKTEDLEDSASSPRWRLL